jgi:AraC-like DNA-binding protein
LFSFIIFFSFSSKLIKENVQEKNNLIYINVLNNAKYAIDSSLKGLHTIITYASYDRSIINAVVSPNSPDNSNDLEVLTTLSTLRAETELINEIYLYIPKNEKVFTSRYEIVTRKQFYKRDVVGSFYASPNLGSSIEIGGRITRIFLHDAKIYLVRDFPLNGDRRLGTLFVQLNTDKFYSILQGQGMDEFNNLLVYDAANKPVFPNNIAYTDSLTEQLEMMSQNDESRALIDDKHIFYAESPITQFRFLFVIGDTSLMPSAKQILSTALPLGIAILIICLLLALFLTDRVFSPIKQLVSNVERESSTSANKASINEFDYLNGTFYNVINRYHDLDRVIKNVLPDISKKLFDDLLTGRPMETAYIASILESIDSPLDTKGAYNVMVLKTEQTITADAMDLLLLAVVRIINEKATGTCRYTIQMTEKTVLAILFEFERTIPELNSKLFELDIEKNILARSKNLHLNISLAKGKLYHSIQEVQFSYEEALQKISIKEQPGEEPENVLASAKTDERAEPYFNTHYFDVRIKKIFDRVLDNDDAGALLLAKQISKAIAETDDSIGNIRLFYNIYIDSVLDKMVSFSINIKGNTFFNQPQDELNVATTLLQMQQYVDNFSEQAITLATEYYKKQQHKYIIAAKKYIESYYSNPNLSLSEVADYVNTNTSYLSKLFKSNLNVNFNDYLNAYRVEKAKAFFDTTDMTMKEVATATGFNSQQNFIRVFKKFEGITPGRY